jgi:hypothetical protein
MYNILSSVLRSSDNNVQNVETCKTEKSCEQYPNLHMHPAYFDMLPLSDSQEDQLISDMKMDTNFDDIVKTLNIPECQCVNPTGSQCSQNVVNYVQLPFIFLCWRVTND